MPVRLVVDNEPSGEVLKDEGIALSFKGIPAAFVFEWESQIYHVLGGERNITENIRLAMEARGFMANHKNWWGTLTNRSMKRGALIETNPPEIWIAKDPDGHARKCHVWIRTGLL